MAFENLTEVLVLERGRSASRDLKKQIYANGKIRRRRANCLRICCTNSRIRGSSPYHPVVPTTMLFPAPNASFNMLKNRGWGGEVDDHVDRGKFWLRSKRRFADSRRRLPPARGDRARVRLPLPASRFCRGLRQECSSTNLPPISYLFWRWSSKERIRRILRDRGLRKISCAAGVSPAALHLPQSRK